MDHDFGNFSDNWEAFNDTLVALNGADREPAIARARLLLAHIRDPKSDRWIRPPLERRLMLEERGGGGRTAAAA